MAEKTDKKAPKQEAKETKKVKKEQPQKSDATTSQAKVKLKGKNWYTIVSPALFESREMGETLAREDKDVIGRKIDVGVSEVTNDMSKYYMKAVFEIEKVEAGRAYTKFSELEILKDYISRMVQRRVRRIDSIDTVTTKDGVLVRVKTVGISIRRINNSMKSLVRAEIRNVVQDYVSKHTLDQLLVGIIGNKLQAIVRKAASKAYPLRAVEVRRLQVMKPAQSQPVAAAQQA